MTVPSPPAQASVTSVRRGAFTGAGRIGVRRVDSHQWRPQDPGLVVQLFDDRFGRSAVDVDRQQADEGGEGANIGPATSMWNSSEAESRCTWITSCGCHPGRRTRKADDLRLVGLDELG